MCASSPTAVGGGFGSKLDLSMQPFVAVAAWRLNRPVGMVYSRPKSIATTTKRHPAQIVSKVFARRDGRIVGMEFHADFDAGAYASWGPTVANRVPVPYVGAVFRPELSRHSPRNPRALRAGRRLPSGFGVPSRRRWRRSNCSTISR